MALVNPTIKILSGAYQADQENGLKALKRIWRPIAGTQTRHWHHLPGI
jgi:hypothetical protein